jgi:transcriptional regulator with XRE-family HTH domain
MPHNSSLVKRGFFMIFQRLENLRIDSDKTQQQIADFLVCNREVYRRYEKGIYEIPVWAVLKLSEFYNTSVDYILGKTDIKEPYPRTRRHGEWVL